MTCTSLSGNLTAAPITFVLAGCSGDTGGSGTAEGNTITWANGHTTSLATAAFALPPSPPKKANCGSLSSRYPIKDEVVGDSTGSVKVDGNLTAAVCILNELPDPWSLAPRSVLHIH